MRVSKRGSAGSRAGEGWGFQGSRRRLSWPFKKARSMKSLRASGASGASEPSMRAMSLVVMRLAALMTARSSREVPGAISRRMVSLKRRASEDFFHFTSEVDGVFFLDRDVAVADEAEGERWM